MSTPLSLWGRHIYLIQCLGWNQPFHLSCPWASLGGIQRNPICSYSPSIPHQGGQETERRWNAKLFLSPCAEEPFSYDPYAKSSCLQDTTDRHSDGSSLNYSVVLFHHLFEDITTNDQVCRAIESKQEKFPIKPCLHSFALVRGYLDSINYSGPVRLSCDNSKLFPAFRPYFDSKEDVYYVVGCTGTPLRIANIEESNTQLKWGLLEKATKVGSPQLISSEHTAHHSCNSAFGAFKSLCQTLHQQSLPPGWSLTRSQPTNSWSTNSRLYTVSSNRRFWLYHLHPMDQQPSVQCRASLLLVPVVHERIWSSIHACLTQPATG